MNYVHLFLSKRWCNPLIIAVLVIMHRIFIYNKDNEYVLYENPPFLMTKLYSSYLVTIHFSL